MARARRKRRRTLKVRLTERALERPERIAEKQNATPEQLVERMVGDFVSMVTTRNRYDPLQQQHPERPAFEPPGYA